MSTSSHPPVRPTLRPLLSSFPTPPSHIPTSPAAVSIPNPFAHGLSASAAPHRLAQKLQVQIHSSSPAAVAAAAATATHSRLGPPPLDPLPPLPSSTSPISLEEQKQIAFLKIRESWHSRYSSGSASASASASDESGEEGEGAEGSSTATSVENPDSGSGARHMQMHLHQKQAEQERGHHAVDVHSISDSINSVHHIHSPVSPTTVNRQIDTPLTSFQPTPHLDQGTHSLLDTAATTEETMTTTTTGMPVSSAQEQEHTSLSSSSPPSPMTPPTTTRTSSPDIQTLIRSRSSHNLRNDGQSRGRKSMPSTRGSVSAEAARLHRATSTPSLRTSAEGDGFDHEDWEHRREYDVDLELDLEDDLDLEADMDSEEDVIDLKTPLPHLMLRLGLLSPHSKLLPRMTPSPEPRHDRSRERDLSGRTSSVGSILSTSSSKHPRDARDTEKRRQRHKDGRLLRGGIGLTTGLGWSDSEDEDAPSELTDRLSRLAPSLSRKSSMAASVMSGYAYSYTSSSTSVSRQSSMNTISRKGSFGTGSIQMRTAGNTNTNRNVIVMRRLSSSSSSVSNSHPHIYHHESKKGHSRSHSREHRRGHGVRKVSDGGHGAGSELGHPSSASISTLASTSTSVSAPTLTSTSGSGSGSGSSPVATATSRYSASSQISCQPSLRHLNFTTTTPTDETTSVSSTSSSTSTQTQLHETPYHPNAEAQGEGEDSSLSRKSSGESWDEGFITAYPHATMHPHVWAYGRGRDEQLGPASVVVGADTGSGRGPSGSTYSAGASAGAGSGDGLDPGVGVGLNGSTEATTPTVERFIVPGPSLTPERIYSPTSVSPPAAVHIARVSSPIARIASPTASFSLPTGIRLAQQDMIDSLHGHVKSETGTGGSALPYLAEHESAQAEGCTVVVSEEGDQRGHGHGHGYRHGVPRLQKPPVGSGVGLKMRMQTKTSINPNPDVALSPIVPEYPYTFPQVPPSPLSSLPNPLATWAMTRTGTAMGANGHLQSHIHGSDAGNGLSIPTIAQSQDVAHGDGEGGGGTVMNQVVGSTWQPPRSPLFDAGDPFRREGPGPQTPIQAGERAGMVPMSVPTTPSKGLGVRSIRTPTPSRLQQFLGSGSGPTEVFVNPPAREASLPSPDFTGSGSGSGSDPNQTPRAKGVTMRTLSVRSQSHGGLKTLLLANPGNRIGGSAGGGPAGTSNSGGGSTPNGQLNTSDRARSGSASAPNTPSIRTISNGFTPISILPSPSGLGKVLPAPAPRPPSKALPPLPHLRASVVGGSGNGEKLKSTGGSVSSLRSTSISSVKSSSSTTSLRSAHSSSSLRVQQGQGEGQVQVQVQSGLPTPVSTPGRSRAISNVSASSSSTGPSTNTNTNTNTALPRPLRPSLTNSTRTSPVDRSSTASTASVSTTAGRPPSTSSTISLITTTTTTPYVRTRTSSNASGGPLKSAIKPPRAWRAGVGSAGNVACGVSGSGSSLGSVGVGSSPFGSGSGEAGLSSSTSSSASLSASLSTSTSTRNRSGIVPPKRYVADPEVAISL